MNASTTFCRSRVATPHQRQYARILMREIELPTDVITLLHRRFFEAASVSFPEQGTRVDDALGALSFSHAKQLIAVLLRERNEQFGEEVES